MIDNTQNEAVMTPETARRMWLDEGLPAGVFRDEVSEKLWDDCCASHPEDPFSEWERRKGELKRDNDEHQ